MKIKEKKVYYCDFCKKHGLSALHLKEHEKHCTLNPNRECGGCENWKKNKEKIEFVKKHFDILMSWKGKDGASEEGILGTHCNEFEDKIKEINEKMGCPFCMFSILRQVDGSLFWSHFDYKKEVEKFWEEKRKESEEEEYENLGREIY